MRLPTIPIVEPLIERLLRHLGLVDDKTIPRAIQGKISQATSASGLNRTQLAEDALKSAGLTPIYGNSLSLLDGEKLSVLLDDDVTPMQLNVIFKLLSLKLIESAITNDTAVKVTQSSPEKIYFWGTDMQRKITRVPTKSAKRAHHRSTPPTP